MFRQNCDAIRAALAASDRLSASVAAHLLVCAPCRAYRRGIVRMNQIARHLPAPPPPAFDASRFPQRTWPASPGTVLLPRRRMIVGMAVVAAVVALGGFVGPQYALPRLLAAEITAAVGKANTWHFVGWKNVENKSVRWEIWGRRAPFFYREQIGDNVLVATDKERIRLVPPGDHRPQGLAIVTPATPGDPKTALSGGPESFIEGIGGEFIGRLRKMGPSGATIALRSPVRSVGGVRQLDDWGVLTVDAKTKLPTRYELHRDVHQAKTEDQMSERVTLPIERRMVEGELQAEYNVLFPSNVAYTAVPPGYAQVDLKQTPDPATLPHEGAATAGGLTIHGSVVEADRDGNLHLRFEGWFGQQKHHAGLPLMLSANPAGAQYESQTHAFAEDIVDDKGNVYVALPNPVGEIDSVNPEWYLIPAKPIASDQPRPTQLTLRATVEGSWYEYLPDARTGTTHSLTRQQVELTLPLAQAAKTLDYDTRPVPRGMTLGAGMRKSLAEQAARVRTAYEETVRQRTVREDVRP